MAQEGRSTVYNQITSKEKLDKVNPENIELATDFIDYLESVGRSKGTIYQYQSMLNVFWCWNLEFNKNKFFVELTKREISKFQSYAMTTWNWSPKRVRTVKAAISSLSNYIENILDEEEGYEQTEADDLRDRMVEYVREQFPKNGLYAEVLALYLKNGYGTRTIGEKLGIKERSARFFLERAKETAGEYYRRYCR